MEKLYCPYCGILLSDNCDCTEEEEIERDERFPQGYCEIKYEDMDSAEAIEGSRFDDINYLRYRER